MENINKDTIQDENLDENIIKNENSDEITVTNENIEDADSFSESELVVEIYYEGKFSLSLLLFWCSGKGLITKQFRINDIF